MKMNKKHVHKRGRPSRADQVRIRKTLYPYFGNEVAVYVVEEETGLSKSTIKKYFRIFADQVTKSLDEDFIEECKKRVRVAGHAIGNQLIELHKSEHLLNMEAEHYQKEGKIPSWVFKELRAQARAIIDSTIKNISLANTPLADEILKQKLKES